MVGGFVNQDSAGSGSRCAELAAVKLANESFYRAFAGLDFEAMDRIWARASPVSCIHPGWALLCGRDAVLASWRGIFQGTKAIEFSLFHPKFFVSGHVAWVVLTEEIRAFQDEQRVHAYAQATNTFVWEDGEWRLVHHHSAPAPPSVIARETACEPTEVVGADAEPDGNEPRGDEMVLTPDPGEIADDASSDGEPGPGGSGRLLH